MDVLKLLQKKREAPAIAMESVVVFPRLSMPILLKKEASILAFEEAVRSDSVVVFVLEGKRGLYRVGTIAHISQAVRTNDGVVKVMVEGLARVKIKRVSQRSPYRKVKFSPIKAIKSEGIELKALSQSTLSQLKDCVNLGKQIPLDVVVNIFNIKNYGQLADVVAFHLELTVLERQKILELIDPLARLKKVNELLAREITVYQTGHKLREDTAKKMGEASREMFLREQLRSIKKELGIGSKKDSANAEYKKKLSQAKLPQRVLKLVKKELKRLKEMPVFSPEVGTVRNYIDWILDLPWRKKRTSKLDMGKAQQVLDKGHYGLDKAKERILEYLAVQKMVGKIKGPILCLVGPPGTGKTSIGRSISTALGREFVRISLGGVRDEAEIRGHRRTYIGALPGRIIQGMKQAGTTNPVFMLDEIDKLGNDFRGDPSSALLEALDPEQNSEFSDHYLEVPYDLSDVMFITTANLLDDIPWALQDRLEVIRFPGFTSEEKFYIARDYILPRLFSDHGLKKTSLGLSDSAIKQIIDKYTFESGVRGLEREMAKVCRKAVRKILEDGVKRVRVDARNLSTFLGPERFSLNLAEKKDEVGVASGLAWTQAGGEVLTIEAITIPGKGNLRLTGSLGEVMQESVQAAFSFAKHYTGKSLAKEDVHLHVPSGAIPKDGPSAGIAMATVLTSILKNAPIKREIAMTGEVTLRGGVLSVGGIKEKVLAAYRGGARTVIMPKENKKNLTDIPKEVKRKLEFVFVEKMEEVLRVSLKPKSRRRKAK